MLHSPIPRDATAYAQTLAPVDPDEVIVRHKDLVRRIAWHVYSGLSSAIELEDLIQIGLLALVEAARTFEQRGAAFAPYASTRIRGAMIDHLRREARMSRTGIVNRRELGRVRAKLESRLGRHASDAEMADAMGRSAGEYHAALASTQAVEQESLDAVYADDQPWFADIAERADTALERDQLQAGLATAIGALADRDALVLQLYFVEELNLEEIGEVLGVGAARVCQIKKAALERLREVMADYG